MKNDTIWAPLFRSTQIKYLVASFVRETHDKRPINPALNFRYYRLHSWMGNRAGIYESPVELNKLCQRAMEERCFAGVDYEPCSHASDDLTWFVDYYGIMTHPCHDNGRSFDTITFRRTSQWNASELIHSRSLLNLDGKYFSWRFDLTTRSINCHANHNLIDCNLLLRAPHSRPMRIEQIEATERTYK